jgi:glycosyltransferase involved in cell wall biosynthesis
VTEVHLVLPAGYDDPRRLSGGNIYDQHLSTGLAQLGWSVARHEIPHAWPAPGPSIIDSVDEVLTSIPDDRVVVLDGLLGAVAATALVGHANRLRLVALVHMPGPPGGPPGSVLRAAQLVITTSDWSARVLIELHHLPGDRVLVAPPGARIAALAKGTEAGGALLCVAAVTSAKGHDVLVSALAGLAAQSWTCACVGALDRERDFVARLHRAVVDAGLADRVQFRGPLVGADLERAYAAADLLVLPTRLESYGMVVTEALAHGLPVIATSVGGVPEAVGRTADGRRPGLLVQAGDHRALRAAITSWLGEPDVRDGLRAAARARRDALGGWDETVSTISTALARLAAR